MLPTFGRYLIFNKKRLISCGNGQLLEPRKWEEKKDNTKPHPAFFCLAHTNLECVGDRDTKTQFRIMGPILQGAEKSNGRRLQKYGRNDYQIFVGDQPTAHPSLITYHLAIDRQLFGVHPIPRRLRSSRPSLAPTSSCFNWFVFWLLPTVSPLHRHLGTAPECRRRNEESRLAAAYRNDRHRRTVRLERVGRFRLDNPAASFAVHHRFSPGGKRKEKKEEGSLDISLKVTDKTNLSVFRLSCSWFWLVEEKNDDKLISKSKIRNQERRNW